MQKTGKNRIKPKIFGILWQILLIMRVKRLIAPMQKHLREKIIRSLDLVASKTVVLYKNSILNRFTKSPLGKGVKVIPAY